MGRIGQFAKELRRRRVLSNATLYIVAAWVVIQVADAAIDAELLRLPLRSIFVASFFGFPVAVMVSWFYDITRQGLARTPPVGAEASFDSSLSRKDYLLLASLVAVWSAAIIVVHTPAPIDKSIAIMPFENRGHDPQGADLAFGVRLDLHTQLEKVQDIKLVARTSAETVDKSLPVPELARTLGVAFIMKGTVERVLDRVRVSVSLIDAESDQAWSFVYDRELDVTSLFDIRDEIAGEITASLQAQLSPRDLHRVKARPTENFEAYQAYLLGEQRMTRRTTEYLADAVEYFQRAVELDPEFALAWASLAYSHYLQMVYNGYANEEEAHSRMEAAIDRALELDDHLGEAYAVLSILQSQKYGDDAAAEQSLRRALELNPNDESAHLWYGGRLVGSGRIEEGLAHQRKALELDPLSPVVNLNLGMTLRELGRFEEALALFGTAVESDPASPGPYERIGEIYRYVYGQFDEAVIWQTKAVTLDPGEPMGSFFLGFIYLDLGDPDQAERWFRRMQEVAPPDFDLFSAVLEPLHIARGDETKALVAARETLAHSPGERYTLGHMRKHDLLAGHYTEARARYERAYPELLIEDEPTIDESNYEVAIDLALVLTMSGEQDRADLLLDRSLEFIRTIPRLGIGGFGIKDVLIYSLQGEDEAALAALRQAIDQGWRTSWWFYLEHDPNLDSIRDSPEFQAMLNEIKEDMAAQLERVRTMQADGELASIPGID